MSLPCLLSCRPGSGQGASKLRSGGAGSKAGYGAGRSSLDAGASIGCKRRLAALPENQVDHVAWKEIFGLEDDDGTSLESLDLKKIGVVGLPDSMATQLVDCFAGKPSVVNIGLYHGITDGTCSKYDIMPGVTVLPTARDVCTWSDVIFLCCSYEDTYAFLRTKSHHKALKGKCVLQLGSGTPEEAVTAARLAKSAGAKYLDAFVFSEGTSNVFNHRLSAMMVSGDKKAWRGVECIVRAAAPASFYGGRSVEWANTIGVGVVTFLASVRMGLHQAQSITSKFGLPNHVLPRVLSSGYMSVVKAIVSNENKKPSPFTRAGSLQTSSVQPATSSAHTFSDISGLKRDLLPSMSGASSLLESPVHGRHATHASAHEAGTPPVGSAEWVSQLERIREVCQKAQVNHALIDGFLAASGASQHPKMPDMNPYMPNHTDIANSHMSEAPYGADQENLEVVAPLTDVFGTGDAPEGLDFDIQEVLKDTDMVGDDVLLAGWAP